MGKLNNVWSYLARHKYLITIVLGILLVGVIDENSFRKYMILQMRYNEARSELDSYVEQFHRDSVRLNALEANHKGVERVARERYFMKRANEDVYVLSTDERNVEEDVVK
ncbi:MAG: septum formation initiator family protein [Prevotellaceae bacterium]|nr:septum formation initiator family protein [Prevotellaceae bacterium]MDO4931648.1 septum formation initiator family protein [Prevotellaceae bacterium]